MLVVMALGRKALLRRGKSNGAVGQQAKVEEAARVVAAIAAEHHLVLTHGFGPQVGPLTLQHATCAAVPAYPVDALDAGTEGALAHLLEQAVACYPATTSPRC